MKWRQKARIQSIVSKFPKPLNYSAYYFLQKTFGTVGAINVAFDMGKAVEIVEQIQSQGHTVLGKSFMEIGTGRTVNAEICLWLCGASKVIAVDLNPYLRPDLVVDSVRWIKTHQNEVRPSLESVIENHSVLEERFSELLGVDEKMESILELIKMEYLAPCDAGKMEMEDSSIDFHISTNVLEHVPAEDIIRILREARRLLKPNGLTVHRVDPSDHFARSDPSITAINFLALSSIQWDKLTNNTFSYHNRLRSVDFYRLFEQCGIEVLSTKETIDERSLAAIANGFPLDAAYSNYSAEELATTFFTFAGKFD